ncbi:cytochrome P450 [Novosphingobium malaysiense]|uniref:Cytochrome P450 n=1 Tax=Novosphingobium malaysiense TaxID=1348853 RepID=A0A0B1ZKU7_9SPHN|nr:cytochrome P450 [Novosphingobium malaysiense]KHK89803.1 hypothetical protein LK12_17920 [Novosphingobium malaysiense]
MNDLAEHQISVSDPEIVKCPYEAYEKLREEAPVYLDPVTQFYVLTRYEDVRKAFSQPNLYLNDDWVQSIQDEVQIARRKHAHERFTKEGWVPGLSIGMLRPERHAPVRAIFNNAFRPAKIKEYEPFIRETAYRFARQFAEKGSGDLIAEFAMPYPLTVIARLVGIPEDDMDRVKEWTAAWIERFGMMLDDQADDRAVGKEIEFQHYTKKIIDRLRAEPDGSILSEIINMPTPDGRYLDDQELFTHIQADLLVAGSETTTNTMSAGVMLLCRNPEINAMVRSDPDKYLRVFIEEVLRLESPVQGLFRVAAEDIELHGVTIPKGALIQLRYGSANRDPEKFGCPAEFDMTRKANAHVAFGGGPHSCAGAPFARAELYWAFKALFDTIDNVELLPDNDFEYLQSVVHRSLKSLNIRFTKK